MSIYRPGQSIWHMANTQPRNGSGFIPYPETEPEDQMVWVPILLILLLIVGLFVLAIVLGKFYGVFRRFFRGTAEVPDVTYQANNIA